MNVPIKKLLKLCADMEELTFHAKGLSMADQVESGMSDEGARLYEEIIKECSAIHLESETQNTYTWAG
jgi:hypothetical protein